MPVVSVRLSNDSLHRRLKAEAGQADVSISTLAERLLDEGLRMATHPGVIFQDGPTGRRPALIGGPDVVEVIGTVVGGDVPVADRRRRAAELLALSVAQIDAAMAYYTEFTHEVDADLDRRRTLADEREAAWLRQGELLAK